MYKSKTRTLCFKKLLFFIMCMHATGHLCGQQQVFLPSEYYDDPRPKFSKGDNGHARNGPWKTYRKDSTVCHTYTYDNGVYVDSAFWYHSNGTLAGKGFFIEGKLEGEFVSYFDNGQVYFRFNYKNGVWHGESESYYKNGQLKTTGYYKEGKQEGPSIGYYKSGSIWWEKVYKDGKEDFSVWVNGNKRNIETVVDGKKQGPAQYYRKDGSLDRKGAYKDNKMDSLWHYYDEKGNLTKQILYEKGVEINRKKFDKEGNEISVAGLLDDKKVGEERYFYPSGELSVVFFLDPVSKNRTGYFKAFYENGTTHLVLEDTLVSNKTMSVRKEYYRNGKLKQVLLFRRDGKLKQVLETRAKNQTSINGGELADGYGEVYLYDDSGSKKKKIKLEKESCHVVSTFETDSYEEFSLRFNVKF